MEIYETDVELDADTGMICAMGVFTVLSTVADAEPYSWGGSRGTERETDATLMQVNLGGLTLTRELASQIVTPSEIAEIEAAAAEQWEVDQGLTDAGQWNLEHALTASPSAHAIARSCRSPQPTLTFTQWVRRKLSSIRRRAIFAAE